MDAPTSEEEKDSRCLRNRFIGVACRWLPRAAPVSTVCACASDDASIKALAATPIDKYLITMLLSVAFCGRFCLAYCGSGVGLRAIAQRLNLRFGSKADICDAKGHVRFTPESRHQPVGSRTSAKRSALRLLGPEHSSHRPPQGGSTEPN